MDKLYLSWHPALGLAFLVLTAASFTFGQTRTPVPAKPVANNDLATLHASPAYAELLLKKTELSSDLESTVIEYTEDFPKVKELRYVLALIDRDIIRLGRVKPTESSKLTLALGKLILRRVEFETELWRLQNNYKDEHPEVKRAKRKVEIFETAIGQILN